MTVSATEFDGFYFQPVSNNEVEFSYFLFSEEKDRGIKAESSSLGDMYHIVLWSFGDEDVPEIKDSYEAILVDPVFYAKQNTKCDNPSYGIIVKKTSESHRFVETYVEKFEHSVKGAMDTIEKLNNSKQKKGWFSKWLN